jgi:hypothetical protein
VISVRRILLRFLLVITASLSAVGLGAVPAIAAVPALKAQIGPTATVIAAGAAVQVRVVYTCPSTDKFPSLFVIVTERVPGGIATGSGSAPTNTVTCNGVQHTVQFGVATSDNFPFATGVAFASGDLAVTLPNSLFSDFSCSGVFSIQ